MSKTVEDGGAAISEDIVKRLDEPWGRRRIGDMSSLLADAADTIEALRGEVVRWRNNFDNKDVQIADLAAERDRLAGEVVAATKHAQLLNKMLGEVEAEAARLKGALEAIEQGDYYGCVSEFAAKALAGETTSQAAGGEG